MSPGCVSGPRCGVTATSINVSTRRQSSRTGKQACPRLYVQRARPGLLPGSGNLRDLRRVQVFAQAVVDGHGADYVDQRVRPAVDRTGSGSGHDASRPWRAMWVPTSSALSLLFRPSPGIRFWAAVCDAQRLATQRHAGPQPGRTRSELGSWRVLTASPACGPPTWDDRRHVRT